MGETTGETGTPLPRHGTTARSGPENEISAVGGALASLDFHGKIEAPVPQATSVEVTTRGTGAPTEVTSGRLSIGGDDERL